MMKKIALTFFVILLIGVFSFTLFACKDKEKPQDEDKVLTIAIPDGAPALAFANIFNEDLKIVNTKVEIELITGSTAAQSIVGKLAQKEVDMAILPTNLAAKAYNSGQEIKFLSANVFGIQYLVSREGNINSINDLSGKKVYCIGQGGTPQIVFENLLKEYNVENVEIEFGEPTTIMGLLKKGDADYAVLAEPVVSKAKASLNVNVAFDLQELWYQKHGTNGYPQAGIVATKSALNDKLDAIKEVLRMVSNNAEQIVKDDVNISEVLAGLKAKGTVALTGITSVDTIKACNIKYVKASEVKESLVNYLSIMNAFNNKAVGGLPDDGFYFDVE